MEHKGLDLAVGAVFVLFYTAHRFNTPSTNRSSTTAARYFLALGAYCIVGLGVYLALVQFPHLVTFLAQGETDDVPEYAKTLSSPLLVALLTTVLLPKVPLLSGLDAWVCKQLQEMAAIPHEVRRLSAALRKQPFAISEEVQAAVRTKLQNEGFDPRDVRFDQGQGPAQIWSLTTALLTELEDWEGDRRMTCCFQEFGDTLEKIEARHAALVGKAKTCFRLVRETSAQDDTDKAKEAARSYADDFYEQVTQLHHDLLEFISRAILRAELTDTARNQRLQSLGFSVTIAHEAFTLNEMMSLFGVIGVALLSALVLLAPASQNVTHGALVVRAIMLSVIYSVAVACVVYPKEGLAFAKRDPGEMRPVAFYIAAGLLAAGVAQLIGLGFNCLLERSFTSGLLRARLTYPWALLSFGTSVVTGFLIDNDPPARWPRLFRLLEGLVSAATMVGVAYLVHGWLVEVYQNAQVRPADYHVLRMVSALGTAGVVGFVIGYLVPTWYREAPRRKAELQAPKLREVPAAVPAGATVMRAEAPTPIPAAPAVTPGVPAPGAAAPARMMASPP
jgi:hypothetical protein